MDTAFQESETALAKIMQDAEKTVFKESELDKMEAQTDLEDILNKYAPLK